MYSSIATQYRWYLNNVLLINEDNNFVIPDTEGSYKVEITDTNGCKAISENYIYSFYSSATISVSSCEAKPGDTVNVKVYLSGSKNLIQSGISGFKGELVLNYSLLYPLDDSVKRCISGNFRKIPITMSLPNTGDSILSNLKFQAVLGNETSTSLSLSEMN